LPFPANLASPGHVCFDIGNRGGTCRKGKSGTRSRSPFSGLSVTARRTSSSAGTPPAAATHDAFFDFAQRDDLYTILRVMHHLHDLLLRIVLKTIGYDGPYQSPISPVMNRNSVDWVQPTTPPAMLGYA
jgi:hypothetical protein